MALLGGSRGLVGTPESLDWDNGLSCGPCTYEISITTATNAAAADDPHKQTQPESGLTYFILMNSRLITRPWTGIPGN